MTIDPIRGPKDMLRNLIPDTALQVYRLARWRVNARTPGGRADGWGRLKSLASQQLSKGADEYPQFLQKADPSLELPYLADARFVGKGHGNWNLNLYRSGHLDGQAVFEKTYLSASTPLQKLTWFHEVVLPSIDRSIRTPSILHRATGEYLTVLYFPFISQHDPLPPERLLGTAKELQHAVADFRWEGIEEGICDFHLQSQYLSHRETLKNFLAHNHCEIENICRIERWVQHSDMPHRFCHGDLNTVNVLACGTFLDLDSCGYYPAGYDYGFILRSPEMTTSVAELENVVSRDLAPDCKATQTAILFFVSVFCSIGVVNKESAHMDDTFLLSLWERVLGKFEESSV